MITVIKDNAIYDIKDEELAAYESKGFSVLGAHETDDGEAEDAPEDGEKKPRRSKKGE